jgi:hypothetical protein
VLIPDLLRAHPEARAVLDRYGLRGCGGPLGPRESLAYFARAHDVPLDRLLGELRAGGGAPAGPVGPRWPADAIYRPFFVAGIAVVLTLGAVGGAYLLVRIAAAGAFTAVGLHEVNAHGHAQIYGWVGLFVMGFAYQAFPRFKHTTLRRPGLAWLSFGLMLGGLLLRSVLEPLAAGWDDFARLAVAGSAAEVVAVGLFAWVIAATWRAAGKPFMAHDAYIATALFWFVVQAVYETLYLAATFRAGPGELVPLVATWQGALRDFQIHGFAALMILGVSQRLLPHMYGFPAPSRRVSLLALVGLNPAVIGEATGLVLMRLDSRAWAGLWYASVLLFAGCAVALVWNWKVFGRAGEADRGLKFVRAGYAWLLVSLAMLVALPAYQFALLPAINPDAAAVTVGFSHAYYGAIRHAITVGFVSQMIVGVAAKVVPTLRGYRPDELTRLWVPFVLINVGCALRVVGQTATDWAAWVFPLAGASGVFEVTGLAVWGVHLGRLMLGRPGWADDPAARAARPVRAADTVGDVLVRHPELLSVFLEFGFRPLATPALRRTVARRVTIDLACQILEADRTAFLAALNARLPKPAVPLTVLDPGEVKQPEPAAAGCSCCEERRAGATRAETTGRPAACG